MVRLKLIKLFNFFIFQFLELLSNDGQVRVFKEDEESAVLCTNLTVVEGSDFEKCTFRNLCKEN